MAFLNKMQEKSNTLEMGLIICPKLTMFESTKSKEMWVQTAKKKRDVKVQRDELTDQAGDDLVEGYSKGITLTSFLTHIQSVVRSVRETCLALLSYLAKM